MVLPLIFYADPTPAPLVQDLAQPLAQHLAQPLAQHLAQPLAQPPAQTESHPDANERGGQSNYERYICNFLSVALILVVVGYALYKGILCAMQPDDIRIQNASFVDFSPAELEGEVVVSAWGEDLALKVCWFLFKLDPYEFSKKCNQALEILNKTCGAHELEISLEKFGCFSVPGGLRVSTNATSTSPRQLHVKSQNPCLAN